MKRTVPVWSTMTLGAAAIAWVLATPASAAAQAAMASAGSSGGGGGNMASAGGGGSSSGGGGASMASAGSSGGGGSSSGGTYNGGGGGGSFMTGGSSSGSGGSRQSGPSRAGATGGSSYAASSARGNARNGRSGRASDGTSNTPPDGARPRDGKPPVGTAVPRGSVPPATINRGVLIFPSGYYGGYYDPWWYGPGYLGYYGGYYDPWYGGFPNVGGYGSYGYSGGSSGDVEEGSLKLKIKPREAEVYEDGYYVGVVDDFDGLFQHLKISTGTHRIEIRAPGYEPLVIEVRISADHATTYQGELKKIP